MPRRIFPASSVTNTTGNPLRLAFHATSTTNIRETDLWTVDDSNNLSSQIPNGVILTDASGNYSAFAGPDDVDALYVVKHDSSSRTVITPTDAVASSTRAPSRSPATLAPLQPAKSLITAFQSGHGWTSTNGATGTNLNDTTDIALGTQSVKYVTGTANLSGIVISSTLTAFDATGMDPKFLIKVEGLTNLADLRFYAGDSTLANAKNWNLIAVETGGSDFNYIKEGEWTWVTMHWDNGSNIGTPSTVRNAVTKYQFRIQAVNGASVKVHLGAVAWVPQTSVFPNGVVSFTYDDSRLTGLTFGRQKLDAYGLAGTAFLIRDRIGIGSPYATLAQFKAARELSGWELACHADNATDHNAGFTTLTAAQVEADLMAERQWFYSNGLGLPDGFAWPRGMSDKTREDAAAKLVSYGRGNYSANCRETFPPANPMRIRAAGVGPTSPSLATLKTYVDSAKLSKGWLVLTFHEILVSGASGSLETNQSVHDGIIDYAVSEGLAVLPMIEVIRRANGT